jgi:hypothetical protein
MTIETIQKDLAGGQVPPPTLAEYRDFLAATQTALMDRLMELQFLYTKFFNSNRFVHKSDTAVKMAWRGTPEGEEEIKLETKFKQIKLLIGAISSHLRVAENVARNLY